MPQGEPEVVQERIFRDFVRERLSLAEAVGRYTNLERRGNEFVGSCPFVAEPTPSFTVIGEGWLSTPIFHCFSCGAHGDIIGFTMKAAKLSFLDTLALLAEEAEIEVPRRWRRP